MAKTTTPAAEAKPTKRTWLESGMVLPWSVGICGGIALLVHFFVSDGNPIWGWSVYFAALSIWTFLLFGIDKRRAKKEKRRVSERNLLGLALLGGGFGGLLGMSWLRHKTRHLKFKLLVPLGAFLETGVLLWASGLFR